MRIVARIVTAGEAGVSRVPTLENGEIEECMNEKGELVEEKLRKKLVKDGVTFSSGDNLPVLHFSAECLNQLRSVLEQMSNRDGCELRSDGETSGKWDKGCNRRMARGYYAFVRFTVDFVGGHIRVRLGYANPREVVGNTELCARDFAELCARMLIHIAAEFARLGMVNVELADDKGCEGLFETARGVNAWFAKRKELLAEVEEQRAKRSACPFHRSGFCSPVQMGCPLLNNGKCPEPRLPEEYDRQFPE